MRLTYHELTTGGSNVHAGRTFIRMSQKIDYEIQEGINYEEPKLFGFENRTGSILRVLMYEIPSHLEILDFLEIIDSYPNARIIRQISHEPIVSPAEREFVRSGLLGIEQIARRQLVRDGKSVYTDRYGMSVYAQNKLSLTGEYEDQDYRITVGDAAIKVESSLNDVPIYTTDPE